MIPNAAASEAIAGREQVCIETRPGRELQKVCLSNSLDMRVAGADFGWWFPEPGNRELHGWKRSSFCLLFANQTLDSPEAGALN